MELTDLSNIENPLHEIDREANRQNRTLFAQWQSSIMPREFPMNCSSHMKFMSDWAVTWNELCESQPNHMAHLNPLLYLCLFISYHKTTFYFNLILTVYHVTAHITCSVMYPGGDYVGQGVAITGTIMTLFLGTFVIKGSWKVESIAEKRFNSYDCGDIESNHTSRHSSPEKNDSVMRSLFIRGLPSISGALRAFLQLSLAYFNQPNESKCSEARKFSLKVRRDGQLTCGGYYYVAEVMWKYLIDTTNTSRKVLYYDSDMVRDRVCEDNILDDKTISLDAPARGSATSSTASTRGKTSTVGKEERWNSGPIATRIMYCGMCVSLAYCLFIIISSWVEQVAFCPGLVGDSNYCKRQRILVIITLGYILDGLQNGLMSINLFVLMAMFFSATEITTSMADSFILRYSPLRLVTVDGLDGANDEQREELRRVMQKDAEERYLFMRHYQRTAGFLWNGFVAGAAIISAVVVVLSYISIQWMQQKIGYVDPRLIVYFWFGVCTELFFLVSLAQANAVTDKIAAMFTSAGVDDFSLIGGRDQWIAYIPSAPIEWRVMGFLFTWNWVGSLALTVVTGVIGMYASSLFPWA